MWVIFSCDIGIYCVGIHNGENISGCNLHGGNFWRYNFRFTLFPTSPLLWHINLSYLSPLHIHVKYFQYRYLCSVAPLHAALRIYYLQHPVTRIDAVSFKSCFIDHYMILYFSTFILCFFFSIIGKSFHILYHNEYSQIYMIARIW